HTRLQGDWSSDVCSSDLGAQKTVIQADANDANEQLGDAADEGRLQDFIRGKGPGVISALLSTAGADYVGFRFGREILPGQGQLRSEERRVGKGGRAGWGG